MSYTENELSKMAIEMLQAKNTADPRYDDVVVWVSLITGLTCKAVEVEIEKLMKKQET